MAGLPPRPSFTPDRRSPPPLRRRDDRPYPQRESYDPRRDEYRRDRGREKERDRDYDRGRRSPSRWDDRDRWRGPPGFRSPSRDRRPRSPPRTVPRSPPRYDRDIDRFPANRYRSRSRTPPPLRRKSPGRPYRGRPYSRSPSPRRLDRRFTPSPPPRRYVRPASPMRGPGPGRLRSRSPTRYPLAKRIKLGSHSIGSPPSAHPARSPERARYRSRSRDSRYRHSRAPSRDRNRSREIREYDTPEGDRLPSDIQRPTTPAREPPSTVPSVKQVKPLPSDNRTGLPPSPEKPSIIQDVKQKTPPAEEPASAPPPNSLPPTPSIPPKPPTRPLLPPKHPRNWSGSESRPTETSLFIPPSIRRGRGRGSSGSYRGSLYRGGGPPDAPRAPRNRGSLPTPIGHEQSQEFNASPSGVDSAPSPPALKMKAETPPPRPSSVEPEESIEQLLKWVNEELIVTDMIQEERRIMDRSKVLRDEYLVSHQRTHILTMEHYKIANQTHQALHEYEMANLELKHLQHRRQGLNKQQELARLGLLGMDYESDGNSIIGTPV
ncbi:hypothetical protein C8R42DRAFT_654702 [Lentinula raphanica]|nr:hypothetical protein C8R42DRAFT_654702 [Lentinula raphanica]